MTEPRPKPNYLFDIGNVILHFDFGKFVRAIQPDCDVAAETMMELIRDPQSELEVSTMETDDFLKFSFEATGYRGTREQFIFAWQNIFSPNEPVIQFIKKLHQRGHPLYLLSNTNQLHVDHFMTGYPIFALFDNWVFSHEAGSAKPNPAIFEHAIAKFGIDPTETVYIDDLQPNVEAGKAFGFQAIHYVGQDLEA